MPINFDCAECGRHVKASTQVAGKKVRCPECTRVIVVPKEAEEVFEVVDDGDSPAAQLAPERRPCPMCGESIAIRAIKCRFCRANLGGKRQSVGASELRQKYRAQMTGLGGLWLVMTCFAIFALLATCGGDPPPGMQQSPVMMICVVLMTLGWLVAGVGTCLKQRWAVYVGLTLSYFNGISSIISLASGANANAPPGFIAGVVVSVLMMAIGIIQGHRVNGMAKQLRKME